MQRYFQWAGPEDAGSTELKLLGSKAISSGFPREKEKLGVQEEFILLLLSPLDLCICAGCSGLSQSSLKLFLSSSLQIQHCRRGTHKPLWRWFWWLLGAHIQICSQGALWNSSGYSSVQTFKVRSLKPYRKHYFHWNSVHALILLMGWNFLCNVKDFTPRHRNWLLTPTVAGQ